MTLDGQKNERRTPWKGLGKAFTAVVTLLGLVTGIIALMDWREDRDETRKAAEQARYATTPEAEYERLAKLQAGVTFSHFQSILEQQPNKQQSAEEGLKRHVFWRPYDFVLAVTDRDQAVLAFAVVVRSEGFHPKFGPIVLGRDTFAEIWPDAAVASGVGCGRSANYFEANGFAATANETIEAVGLDPFVGYHDDADFARMCNAGRPLAECRGVNTLDDPTNSDFSREQEVATCLQQHPEAQRLREGLRPNTYIQAAPYTDITLAWRPSPPELIRADEAVPADSVGITTP